MLCAQAVENGGDLLSQFLRRNTDDLKLGSGGISKGAENIEHGTNSDFASGDSGVFHCRVEVGSEHESNANYFNALSDSLSPELNLNPQCLQDIGATTVAGYCPVTMLGYFDSCAGDNKGGRCGDIKTGGAIASCPASVN